MLDILKPSRTRTWLVRSIIMAPMIAMQLALFIWVVSLLLEKLYS